MCEMVQANSVPRGISVDRTGCKMRTPQHVEANDEPPENEYDKDHRFVMLGMKGQLIQMRVHGEFESENNCKSSAALTGHSPEFGRDVWRRVTTESEREVIVGWASIEHPAWQDEDQTEVRAPSHAQASQMIAQSEVVHALFMIRLHKGKGGLGYGNSSDHQPIYLVLFLKPVDVPGFGKCYERLGTGRLVGNDVDASFQGIQDFWQMTAHGGNIFAKRQGFIVMSITSYGALVFTTTECVNIKETSFQLKLPCAGPK